MAAGRNYVPNHPDRRLQRDRRRRKSEPPPVAIPGGGPESLLQSVAGSPRFLGDSVVVVFDGRGQTISNQRFGQVTAVFSTAGSSADDVIKARAQAARDPVSLVIVTNDAAVRDYCRLLGCTVSGSENLLEQLATPKKLRRLKQHESDYEDLHRPGGVSTSKKGNPKRLPKSQRHPRDYRF